MNAWWIYSYFDFEEAYYKTQYNRCKEIGLYLLGQLRDPKSKELYRQLQQFKHDWMHPSPEGTELLLEVKIWLMINQ